MGKRKVGNDNASFFHSVKYSLFIINEVYSYADF